MTEKLISGLKQLNINVNDEKLTANNFEIYMNELISWNENVNLTAITEPDEVVTKHFLDSVSAQEFIKEGASVIDVGCGAGFPGLPIKMVRDDIKLTLLDSLDKRLKFLAYVINETGVNDVTLLHSRAEDGGRNKDTREKFDVAVSRAVANMSVLLEYCLPFVKVGGRFIALKGPAVEEELASAKKAMEVLGGKLIGVKEINVPFTDLSHNIVIVEKVRGCSKEYPRKAGTPSKKPIK